MSPGMAAPLASGFMNEAKYLDYLSTGFLGISEPLAPLDIDVPVDASSALLDELTGMSQGMPGDSQVQFSVERETEVGAVKQCSQLETLLLCRWFAPVVARQCFRDHRLRDRRSSWIISTVQDGGMLLVSSSATQPVCLSLPSLPVALPPLPQQQPWQAMGAPSQAFASFPSASDSDQHPQQVRVPLVSVHISKYYEMLHWCTTAVRRQLPLIPAMLLLIFEFRDSSGAT